MELSEILLTKVHGMWFSKDSSFSDAIKVAPGPAPWYLGQPASDLSTPALKLHWERDPKAGPSALKDEAGKIYAYVAMYCYVWRFSNKQFIVWFVQTDPLTNESLSGNVRFEIYDIEELRPLGDGQSTLEKLVKKVTSFVAGCAPLAHQNLKWNSAIGSVAVDFDPAFYSCEELCVLVSDLSWESAQVNLWIVRPAAGHIQVTSQDWFNKGAYDFGYQWITRVTRERATQKIVGDGIRIGAFVLDASGSLFEKWIKQ